MTKIKFVRQGIRKKISKIKDTWRKPRGIHNKLRRKFKGHGRVPSIGYGSTKNTKHLHRSGLFSILVYNIEDLNKIDPKKEACLLSGKMGVKNKIMIVKKAEELKIKILNIKDIQSFLKEVEEKVSKKKKERDVKKKKKEEVKETKKEEEKRVEKTREEKEKEEKLEKKKVLEGKKALKVGV